MFGSAAFHNDPFFNQHSDIMSEFDRMDQMMSSFRSSFGIPTMPMMPSIGYDIDSRDGRLQRHGQRQDMAPFGHNMFGNIFENMDVMFSEMQNNPSAHTYSSSKVISYSSDGSGQPKYYEASSETTSGPGGVRQTRKSERNSMTGLDRMAIGHHIYDRGHVVERSRNRRTNEKEEKQDFLNMDEDEREAFHREWQEKARLSGRSIGHYGRHQHHRVPRAIDSAEYHRSNLDRSGARHRGDGPSRRRVQINSRAEEI